MQSEMTWRQARLPKVGTPRRRRPTSSPEGTWEALPALLAPLWGVEADRFGETALPVVHESPRAQRANPRLKFKVKS